MSLIKKGLSFTLVLTMLISAFAGVLTVFAEDEVIPVHEISLNKTKMELEIGKSFKLVATVLPEDANDKTVVWSSSDEDVLAIDENGNITGLKKGEALVSATAGNLVSQCSVKVVPNAYETLIDVFVRFFSSILTFFKMLFSR